MKATRWKSFLRCQLCDAPACRPCVGLPGAKPLVRGKPLNWPHPGRERSAWVRFGSGRRRPGSYVGLRDDRLTVWRRLARRGVLVAEIAAQLGMTRPALDRMVVRARKIGHPDAVYHLLASSPGTSARIRTGAKRCPPASGSTV